MKQRAYYGRHVMAIGQHCRFTGREPQSRPNFHPPMMLFTKYSTVPGDPVENSVCSIQTQTHTCSFLLLSFRVDRALAPNPTWVISCIHFTRQQKAAFASPELPVRRRRLDLSRAQCLEEESPPMTAPCQRQCRRRVQQVSKVATASCWNIKVLLFHL